MASRDEHERVAVTIDARYAVLSAMRLLPQAILRGMAQHRAALNGLRSSPDFAALRSRHVGLARFDEIERGLSPIAAPNDPWHGSSPSRWRADPELMAAQIDRRMEHAVRCGLLPQAIFRTMLDDTYMLDDLRMSPHFDQLCQRHPYLLRFSHLVNCFDDWF